MRGTESTLSQQALRRVEPGEAMAIPPQAGLIVRFEPRCHVSLTKKAFAP